MVTCVPSSRQYQPSSAQDPGECDRPGLGSVLWVLCRSLADHCECSFPHLCNGIIVFSSEGRCGVMRVEDRLSTFQGPSAPCPGSELLPLSSKLPIPKLDVPRTPGQPRESTDSQTPFSQQASVQLAPAVLIPDTFFFCKRSFTSALSWSVTGWGNRLGFWGYHSALGASVCASVKLEK